MAVTESNLRIDEELAGLDALELGAGPRESRLRRVWRATWPKLGAVVIGLGLWQLVVLTGWKSETILPGPTKSLRVLWDELLDGTLPEAVAITMSRALSGYAIALVIGLLLGAVVARVPLARAAFGSLITGLQTMPSIAWFPLAIVLFPFSEKAILFVVVLGAAPAIANGLIAGVDNIQPILLRAGRVLGARGLRLWGHVILPASLPSLVGGLKQGWAFAWRSLMAGELLVIIRDRPSIGFLLQESRELADYEGLLATMLLILVIGLVVDAAFFGTLERSIRRRWGLIDPAG
jgi:NitT/TauT family transport system permease protein